MTDSALPEKTLVEIRGVLKFVDQGVDDIINNMKIPEPKPWVQPTHPMDDLGQICNMSGWEIKELDELARRDILDNPMLQKAYRDFIMIAKLVLSDQMEVSRAKVRRIAEDKAKQETTYLTKMAAYENKKKSLRQSWHGANRAAKFKWEYLVIKLNDLIKVDNSLNSLSSWDQALVRELEKRNLLDIQNGKISYIDEQLTNQLSIQEISDIFAQLPNY